MGRSISQAAFEAVVRENMEDLGMDADEALADAVETLTLQGVDLSGIVKRFPGGSSAAENPVLKVISELKSSVASLESSNSVVLDDNSNLSKLADLLDKLYELLSLDSSDNASIAARNGGVEVLLSACCLELLPERPLLSALKALGFVVRDVESSETFRQCDGPKVVMDLLHEPKSSHVVDCALSVIAAASTGNEVVKESFMDLKIDQYIVGTLNKQLNHATPSLYDAFRVLLTPDDNRVVASQVYGYARRFAEIGAAEVLVKALREKIKPSSVPSACTALKAVAVNDEICRMIADNGGIDVIIQCIDESGENKNKFMARSCCSLLSKLAGSDANKTAIIQQGGLKKLMNLSSNFSEDSPVLQEVMSIITVLSLRSPENATRIVEAGYGELALEAMKRFPSSAQLQRQACLMIRNLVVRNPENRAILLSNGVEKLIRKAKAQHGVCREAATDALRDLGVDGYNT